MAQKDSAIKEKVEDSIRIKKPGKYKVVFHNDDFTTMDFVVKVLRQVYYKLEAEAFDLMLKVHNEGKATVGVYSKDIAITRTSRARKMAMDESFPLMITIEEV